MTSICRGRVPTKEEIANLTKRYDTIGQWENVELQTPERTTVFGDVIVRAVPGFVLELHIDTDEANAANVQGTVMARIIQ